MLKQNENLLNKYNNATNSIFWNNINPKNNITRFFHLSSTFSIYPNIDSEYNSVDSEELEKDSTENKSELIDKQLDVNKQEAKEVREDLRNVVKSLNNQTKARVSDAKVKSDFFHNLVNDQEKEIGKIHDDAYTTSNANNWEYEDKINESGIRKALFAVTKSESSAIITGSKVNDEEKEMVHAVKGLTKDIYQLRNNRFELMNLKSTEVNENKNKNKKGSLIDEYADLSTDMPDYTGGED